MNYDIHLEQQEISAQGPAAEKTSARAAHIRIGARDRERFARLNTMETELHAQGFARIAGVDEAGRGPLAGPVAAAACILDPAQPVYGLNDSKKLSPARRSYLAEEIREKALACAVAFRSAARIDAVNVLEATKEAMQEAVEALQPAPDMVLLDAVQLPALLLPQRSLIQGDARVNAIAAASILAKTARDSYMTELDTRYPGYGFAQHKGYGTAAHYAAIRELGLMPEHRLSFLHKLRAGRSEARLAADAYGQRAEEEVCQHLRRQGYQILERNFHLRPFGEIDLMARKEGQLLLIEVKARHGTEATAKALQAITPEKLAKLRLLAAYYQQSRGLEDLPIRLLGALYTEDTNATPHIHYVELL